MKSSKPLLDEQLAKLKPPYKSRGEAQIGRLLDRYGIPFFYEQPLIVYDRGRYRIWHPDFTLPTLNGLIMEYAGMPDRPDYMVGINHKQKVYLDNAIRAMFVYPWDLTGPNWSEKLHKKLIEKF